MIKKSVFEDELIAGMQKELVADEKSAAINNLDKAVEYLHTAAEVFEEAGMKAQADAVLNILLKFAIKHRKPKDPRKVSKPEPRSLTSEQMIKNLLDHGTEFNMASDMSMNDLLEADIGDNNLEVSEPGNGLEMDFEDEI